MTAAQPGGRRRTPVHEITELILDDHDQMRRAFARLDELRAETSGGTDVGPQLEREWQSLATLLDVHAAAEEELVYPLLLRRGANADDETDDAIRDHNDIRDGVQATNGKTVGGDEWWDTVLQAREANSTHMAEEEREALPDLRLHVDAERRTQMGVRWEEYKQAHPGAAGLRRDLDPQAYIDSDGSVRAAH
jgi:hypothetical protein